MEEFNKLKEYLEEIGQGVENFDWKLEYSGLWHLDVEGESCDGEEQNYSFDNHKDLISMLEEVKETF